MPAPHPIGSPPGGSAVFATTHWSVVVEAGQQESAQSRAALEQLCRAYWYPLYAYVRRKGHSPDDAQDLTQEFFARLLAKNYLAGLDRRKGKFRSFLLASLEHFLAKEWTRASRQKRGGGRRLLSLDDQTAEQRYRLEPTHELTPEKIYERRWALTLLDEAMLKLRDECRATHKTELFERVKSVLSGENDGESYAVLGVELKMTEGALKVAIHRLRQRYGELLRAEIAQTVSDPAEVDGEIRYLFSALS